MKQQEPMEEWERELHRELDALPEREAPPTLIPSVMNRIHAAESPAWYRASWWQWPPVLRAASVALALAVLGGLGWLSGSFVDLGLGQLAVRAYVELKESLLFAINLSETLLGSNATFWREHGQLILIAVAAMVLATYLTCVAAGTALYQLAWRRTL